jgi:HAD superfamily hydrolase (TIGR01549 family)
LWTVTESERLDDAAACSTNHWPTDICSSLSLCRKTPYHLPVIRLALFDLDNTLFDRRLAYTRWAQSFARRRGLGSHAVDVLCDADEDGFATRHYVFTTARRLLHLTDSVDQLIEQYRQEYVEMLSPDEAVLASLRRLRSNDWRIGIVTNGPITQHEKIRRTGLLPLLDGCCISDEFGVRKPDARIFNEAVRLCCGGPITDGAGWMIGDSPTFDIAGGRQAKLRTVWMQRGRSWIEPDFAPDLIASDLDEAIELLLSN